MQELGLHHDGSVLIRDGMVEQANSTRRIENLIDARNAAEINAAGRIVIPGFVDCHTHLGFPPPGSADEGAGIRMVHGSSGRLLQTRCRKFIHAMARHGTTTMEVETGCGMDAPAEFKLLRVMRALDGDPVDVVSTFPLIVPAAVPEVIIERFLHDMLETISRRRIASFAAVDWREDGGMPAVFSRLLSAASRLGFECRIHAADRESGAIAAAIGHKAACVDHVERATAADAAMLSGSDTVAVLLPSTIFTDSRVLSGRVMIDNGVAVALGTNFNAVRGGTFSMQMAIALAVARMQFRIEEAICAATINAAHALRCADRAGSLEKGKSADLVMLNASDYRDLSGNFGTNLVHMVMKRGKVIYREGAVEWSKGTREW